MTYSKKNHIAVLLATFNGSRFLHEQIDSILNQNIFLDSNFEISIFIRDDISTDNTMEIVSNYQSNFKNIYVITDRKKIGAKQSFLKLLSDVTADFYFFCDQDDIWHPNKMQAAISSLKTKEVPALFFSDLNLVNEKGKSLGKTFWQHQNINTALFNNPKNFLYNSLVTGCSVAINRQLRDKFISLNIPWQNIFYHDQMLSILAAKIGDISYSSKCYINYRQHPHNVIGSSNIKLSKKIKIIYSYIRNINSLLIILRWHNTSIYDFLYNKTLLILKRIL